MVNSDSQIGYITASEYNNRSLYEQLLYKDNNTILTEGVGDIIGKFVEFVKNIFNKLIEFIKGIIGKILSGLKKVKDKIFGGKEEAEAAHEVIEAAATGDEKKVEEAVKKYEEKMPATEKAAEKAAELKKNNQEELEAIDTSTEVGKSSTPLKQALKSQAKEKEKKSYKPEYKRVKGSSIRLGLSKVIDKYNLKYKKVDFDELKKFSKCVSEFEDLIFDFENIVDGIVRNDFGYKDRTFGVNNAFTEMHLKSVGAIARIFNIKYNFYENDDEETYADLSQTFKSIEVVKDQTLIIDDVINRQSAHMEFNKANYDKEIKKCGEILKAAKKARDYIPKSISKIRATFDKAGISDDDLKYHIDTAKRHAASNGKTLSDVEYDYGLNQKYLDEAIPEIQDELNETIGFISEFVKSFSRNVKEAAMATYYNQQTEIRLVRLYRRMLRAGGRSDITVE